MGHGSRGGPSPSSGEDPPATRAEELRGHAGEPAAPDAGAAPTGHRGRLRLVRRPLAMAALVAGIVAVAGGTVGLTRLTGHAGQAARPLAKAATARAPGGIFAAPPQPRSSARPVPRPVSLIIPAIGVRTRLVELGRTRHGTLQVPSSTAVAGWYRASPRPGEIGSAIIAGHIDSVQGPAVFFRLRLLRPGELVYVRRADGKLVVFRVYSEHMYAKARFPTQQVYGPEPDAELHLITCGGVFDSATGSYLSNVVVYASEIRHRAPRHHRHGHHRRPAHHPRARH